MALAPATARRPPGRWLAALVLLAACMAAVVGLRHAPGSVTAEEADPLRVELWGQAGGPARALAVEPSRALVFLGAGRGVSVLVDGGREGLRLVGRSLPLDGEVAGLTAGFRWLAAWTEAGDGLSILDTSDPARPVTSTWLSGLAGPVTHALSDGDRLYVALGAAGLATYRVGDAPPEALSRLSLPGRVGQLAATPINGRRTVFAALGAAGLAVIDMEDAAAPVVLSTIAGHVEGVAAWGRLAYVAQREVLPAGGLGVVRLAIYDLSRPAQPWRVVEPRPDLSIGTRPVTDGVLLYSCVGSSPVLEPIDVRSPQQPVRRGFMPEPVVPPRWLGCAAVAAAGSRVYLASWSDALRPPEERHGGLALFQRQPSSRLSFEQSLDLRGNVGRVIVDGSRAWLTDGAAAGTPSTGLRDVDLEDPRRPLMNARFGLEQAPEAGGPGTPTPFAPAGDLVADSSWVHAATASRYLRLERAGKGLAPESQLVLPAMGAADSPPRLALWADGVALAVAGTDPGHLLRLSLSSPPAVAGQGDLHRSGLVTDLAPSVAGLLATVRQGGLRVLLPQATGIDWELASLALPAESLAVAADGPLAFVANGEAGLIAVDLSDPADPVEVGRNAWSEGPGPPAAAVDLVLDLGAAWNGGRRGLVLLERSADAEGGHATGRLRLVDAADAARPRSLTSLDVPAARALTQAGDLVMLASDDDLLDVYRISGLAPSPMPSATATATPSPTATASPTSPTGTPTEPSPTPTTQVPVVTPRTRFLWLPALDLSLVRRTELYVLLDGGWDGDAIGDWELRSDLAGVALAALAPERDQAALLRFDAAGATLEAAGRPDQVAARLAALTGAPGSSGRLDLALAGVDTAGGLLPPAPDRRDRVVLILAGPDAASAGSAAGHAAVERRLAALEAQGARVFALVDEADALEGWRRLLAPDRVASRTDADAARARVAEWAARGWW